MSERERRHAHKRKTIFNSRKLTPKNKAKRCLRMHACVYVLYDHPALRPRRTTPHRALQFANDVKRGKGGDGIFLDPWWLFGPGHEVTANKRLWDLGAELVDNIPHSKEVRSGGSTSRGRFARPNALLYRA